MAPQSIGLRNVEDWRSAKVPRRYFAQAILTPPAAGAGSNLFGLRKLAANPDVYISRIRIHRWNSAAATPAAAMGWKRATTVAGGNQITAADIFRPDSTSGVPTLECRANAVTGTKANQYILTHPAPNITATTVGGGTPDDWTARDISERIRLTGDEGLILDWVTAGNTLIRIHLLVVWEEVS